MNRRRAKQVVLSILKADSITAITKGLSKVSPSDTIGPLFSALCSPDESVKWHGVSGFGVIVPKIADENLESARVIMRRLLWSLNDESGGIGWGAPEAMAEVMARDERLAKEYFHMLLSYTREDGPELFQDGNFLELPMLQRGLLWGLGRLIRLRGKLTRPEVKISDISQYLDSPDHVVRGMAIWVLLGLNDRSETKRVADLTGNSTEVAIYWEGDWSYTTVGKLALKYLGE